jgi:hypothetical protein
MFRPSHFRLFKIPGEKSRSIINGNRNVFQSSSDNFQGFISTWFNAMRYRCQCNATDVAATSLFSDVLIEKIPTWWPAITYFRHWRHQHILARPRVSVDLNISFVRNSTSFQLQGIQHGGRANFWGVNNTDVSRERHLNDYQLLEKNSVPWS